MKAHIKIPRGWRRLKAGETAERDDRILKAIKPADKCPYLQWGEHSYEGKIVNDGIFIRKIARKGAR